jgi:hypothetical protein
VKLALAAGEADLTLSPAGAPAPPAIQVGDFILTRADHSVVDSAIRFGQRLRYRKDRRWAAWCNHAAGIVSAGPEPVLVEMLAHGATVSPLSKYQGREYVLVRPVQTPERAQDAADYWQWLADTHVRYGYFSILLDAVFLATSLPIGGSWRDRPVCSAAVAAGLALNPWRASAAGILPADLAYFYGARRLVLPQANESLSL